MMLGNVFRVQGTCLNMESMAMLNEKKKTNKMWKIIKTNGDGVHC